VFGDFLLLNSNGGYFFYAANHPTQGTEFDPDITPPLPAELRGAGEPAIDRALFRTAFGFIAADPVRFVRLSWSRIGDYFPRLSLPVLDSVEQRRTDVLIRPLPAVDAVRRAARARPLARVRAALYIAYDAALHISSWAAPHVPPAERRRADGLRRGCGRGSGQTASQRAGADLASRQWRDREPPGTASVVLSAAETRRATRRRYGRGRNR
jgi:hypothetical protein